MVAIKDQKAAELSESLKGFLRISNFYAENSTEAFFRFVEKSGLVLTQDDVNITLI
jgi:hypothetical protein